MKCSKRHTPIEWNEKDLFCCPSCLLISVQDNQRNVIEQLNKSLAEYQKALFESQASQKELTDKFIEKNSLWNPKNAQNV